MKLSGSTYVFLAALGSVPLIAAPTVDYTRRNESLGAAGSTLRPASSRPAQTRSALQEKRVTFGTMEKETAALAGRRATVEVVEATPKNVRSPSADARRPASTTPPLSPLNRQPAVVSTTDSRKFPLVSKYQDRLASTQSVAIGRTPAVARGAEARLNRFVFRHNAPPPVAPSSAVPVAASGDRSR